MSPERDREPDRSDSGSLGRAGLGHTCPGPGWLFLPFLVKCNVTVTYRELVTNPWSWSLPGGWEVSPGPGCSLLLGKTQVLSQAVLVGPWGRHGAVTLASLSLVLQRLLQQRAQPPAPPLEAGHGASTACQRGEDGHGEVRTGWRGVQGAPCPRLAVSADAEAAGRKRHCWGSTGLCSSYGIQRCSETGTLLLPHFTRKIREVE